jgi:hypothetical protein
VAVESARDELWREMRVYLREDAGYRPEFVLGDLSTGDSQRLFDRLVSDSESLDGQVWFDQLGVARPVQDVANAPTLLAAGEIAAPFVVFVNGVRSGTRLLPPIGVIFSSGEVAFFWTHEDAWDEDAVVAFVGHILALQRELGSSLAFQPRVQPEPFIVASRTALRRYAEESSRNPRAPSPGG